MREPLAVYHVFTDKRDTWTRQVDKAKVLCRVWRENVLVGARLYRETRDRVGETIDEECLEATGEYPLERSEHVCSQPPGRHLPVSGEIMPASLCLRATACAKTEAGSTCTVPA